MCLSRQNMIRSWWNWGILAFPCSASKVWKSWLPFPGKHIHTDSLVSMGNNSEGQRAGSQWRSWPCPWHVLQPQERGREASQCCCGGKPCFLWRAFIDILGGSAASHTCSFWASNYPAEDVQPGSWFDPQSWSFQGVSFVFFVLFTEQFASDRSVLLPSLLYFVVNAQSLFLPFSFVWRSCWCSVPSDNLHVANWPAQICYWVSGSL